MDNALKRIRILLVDDHPEVLKQVGARLAHEEDFHICSTATNMNLLFQIAICKPDVILIDPSYSNGEFNYEGIRAVREKYSGMKVIVLTAIADTMSQVELKKSGVCHILEKGVSSEYLVKIVREAVSIKD